MRGNPFVLNPWSGVILPILLWVVITPWLSQIDFATSQFFFKEGYFSNHSLWEFIYRYGILPAWATVGMALIGLGISFFSAKKHWRKPCLYLILTLVIGSGLFVHILLKDHWGRPRPRQVVEFGGTQPFRPYYLPNLGAQIEPSKSFSCGHCTMGFYFFAVALLGSAYRKPLLYWSGMGLATGLGVLLSLARIAQGGHFVSDTLASALIMWLIAWGFAYLFFIGSQHERANSQAT